MDARMLGVGYGNGKDAMDMVGWGGGRWKAEDGDGVGCKASGEREDGTDGWKEDKAHCRRKGVRDTGRRDGGAIMWTDGGLGCMFG